MALSSGFEIRPGREDDRLPLAMLFATIAEERDGIAAEPPVDVEGRAKRWSLEGMYVAVAGDEIVGWIDLARSVHGYGEIGMAIAREWRGAESVQRSSRPRSRGRAKTACTS